jgi:hypothetical protein
MEWQSRLKGSLKKDPLFRKAAEAEAILKRLGCAMFLLKLYIEHIAGCRRANVSQLDTKSIARRIRTIQRHLNSAAEQADLLNAISELGDRLRRARCHRLSEEIAKMVARLSSVAIREIGEVNVQREALLNLLEHVKLTTGRYRFAEVSALINAERIWYAMTNKAPVPELSHDVDALKMVVQRHKKRLQQNLKEQKERPGHNGYNGRTSLPT